MRARTRTGRATSLMFVSSLLVGVGWINQASAQNEEEAPAAGEEEAPPPPPARPHKKAAEATEDVESAPPPAAEPEKTGSFTAESHGWRLTIEGRMNSFVSYGWGNYQPTNVPDGDMSSIVGGGGLHIQQQRDANGNFHTVRIRNGFVGNVLTFNLSRNVTETTTLTAHLSLWSDIETNLQVYSDALTWMQEGYLHLEGPWGSFTAGRQLALFSRGAVEIDANYMHGYGLGYPCNFDGVHPTCGMIGFGVLFPFFRSGLLYTTPSLGGFTLAAGLYDPVILAGKWERAITPTAELELAFTRPIGRHGMFKLFGSGIWQQLGAAGNPPLPGGMPDNRAVANKTVTQYGAAGGFRLEAGPVRLGATGHFGKGLGFFYAQENSEAAAYSATDTSDPRDGDLRTFRGYYAQVMVVLGKIDVAGGYGVSQLVPLSFDNTATTHLPKQNQGISAGIFFHIRDYLVYGIDYFDGVSTWWGTSFSQKIHAFNSGITMTF